MEIGSIDGANTAQDDTVRQEITSPTISQEATSNVNAPSISPVYLYRDFSGWETELETAIVLEETVVSAVQTLNNHEPVKRQQIVKDSKQIVKQERISRRQARTGIKGSITEKEKNLALDCIKEIKESRQTLEDSNSFRCRICAERSFSALNSLLFHYRTHAGVKPYECDECEATFTRQHSLNYHILIHLNQSRFVCEECGSQFRHPSHFKEHQRRHTGETPFQCIDCSSKFKTRSTYKRHLEKRHGKVLTAQGISEISKEVRKPSMPRRKYGLPFLRQNLEAINDYEEAQKNFENSAASTSQPDHFVDATQTFTLTVATNNDSFQQLLQAAAFAAHEMRE